MIRKSLAGAALAVLTALGVLTGCAEDATNHDAGDTSDAPGEHGAVDVTFLQQMIPHHEQAVDMTTMVAGHTTTAAVVDLAGRIEKAQGPEIEQMTGWLTSWDQPTTPPATGTEHSMPGMDHGSHMPGMMSEAQLSELEKATGAAFDRQWLSTARPELTPTPRLPRTPKVACGATWAATRRWADTLTGPCAEG